MRQFQEKNRWKAILYSRVTVFVLLVIVLLLGKATWNVYAKYSESARMLNELRKQNALLLERQKTLALEIEELKTEKGIEREIRERYGVAKEGEKVIHLVDPEENRENATEEETGFVRGLWTKFLGIFR